MMISPTFIGPLLGAIVVVVLLGGSYFKGRSDSDTIWQAKASESKIEALNQEAAWREALDIAKRTHDEEKAVVQSRLTTALNSLRDRTTVRLPDSARAACAGATGRELSKPDAGFLVRLAAEADDLRASLRACQAYVNTVNKK